MDATRSEYLLALMISNLVSKAQKFEYHEDRPEYNIQKHYSIKYDYEAIENLLIFCNEFAASIDEGLLVDIPTEAQCERMNKNLRFGDKEVI